MYVEIEETMKNHVVTTTLAPLTIGKEKRNSIVHGTLKIQFLIYYQFE